jgi:hypothetical protein
MDTTSLWTTWSYFRFALLVSNVTLETYFSEEDDTSQQKMNPHETAAVICKIDYSIAKATILRGSKDGSTQVYNLTAARHTNGLTGIMLGEIMHNALRAARDLDMRDYVPDQEELKYFPQVTAPLYYVLLRTLAGQQSMSRFLSADTLQSSARQVSNPNLFGENCIRTANVVSTANATFSGPRLHMGLVPLRAMVVGFVLLIILTSCIMFTTCNEVVPQDPGYLATGIQPLC